MLKKLKSKNTEVDAKEKEVDLNDNNKYQLAYNEWEQRIGSAKTQAKTWRFVCVITIIICIFLVMCIFIQLNNSKNYVYVAEVSNDKSVVNLTPLPEKYTPTNAQKEYFVSNFIKSITEIPLDPVVLRNNWQLALSSVSGQAKNQLQSFALETKPFSYIGKETRTTDIVNLGTLGNNTFNFTFRVKTVNKNGKVISNVIYNGNFTFSQSITPVTMRQMLNNPLGFRIGYFSINKKG